MSKKQLKVLVACEESQRVTQSFRDLGHEAYSCDLIECSGGHLEWHIKQDVVPLLNGHCTFNTCDGKSHTIDSKWDLIIAHPPCTYFSTAGACRLFKSGKLNEERYQKGLIMKDLFLKILNADCEHIMIENPTPMNIWKLPPPQQVIQPWMFGDNFQKRTLLWLKNLPLLIPSTTSQPKDTIPYVNGGTFRTRNGKRERLNRCGITSGSRNRSKTFKGIAKAIASQWSSYLQDKANQNDSL